MKQLHKSTINDIKKCVFLTQEQKEKLLNILNDNINEIEYTQSLDIRFWIDGETHSLGFDLNEKWVDGSTWENREIDFNFDNFKLIDICNENNDNDISTAYTLVYFEKKELNNEN